VRVIRGSCELSCVRQWVGCGAERKDRSAYGDPWFKTRSRVCSVVIEGRIRFGLINYRVLGIRAKCILGCGKGLKWLTGR
jgi:hypothetical protein